MNNFNTLRRYFEIKTAYNIDRIRFQSLTSTAAKLEIIGQALAKQRTEVAVSLAASMSRYWIGEVMASRIFAERHVAFSGILRDVINNGGMPNDDTHDDIFCQYIHMPSITPGVNVIMDLVSGDYLTPSMPKPMGDDALGNVVKIGRQYLPVYNFTRIECGKSASIVSGCFPVS